MSSSERVLGRGLTAGRAAAARASEAAASSPAGAPSVVLRGRPRTSGGHGGRPVFDGPAGSRYGSHAADASVLGAGQALDAARGIEELLLAAEQHGFVDGRAIAETELRAAIEAAGGMAAQLEALAPRESKVIAHAVVELALTISRRILDTQVRIDPAVLAGTIDRAVGVINGAPEAQVLLHPDAVEPVRTAWEAAHGQGYLNKRWIFMADATLPLGGCVIRYEHGHLEAGLEAQLAELGVTLDAAIPSLLLPDEASW